MSSGSNSGSEMSKRRALPGTSSAVVAPDLASLFECPVCFDYVLPPILQCQSGHLVCSSCRPKLTCCPTCRGPLGNIRNLAMEKVASTVMFPCKYAATGCSVLQLYSEKVEHEEICEFRPFQCPCPGASCKWLGSLDQVMPHLVSSHKSITTLQGEDIVFLATDINLPGAVDWVMMQSCFGHCFMLVLEKQEKFDGHQQFFALVQLIGSRKQAENFGYRLELNRQRRRLTWEATPRSIHEGIATAIVSSDCLVFDTSVAQLFADNGNLGINIIKLTWENANDSDLTGHRLNVIRKAAENCLTAAGYQLSEDVGFKWIHCTTKSDKLEGDDDFPKSRILCSAVLNSETGIKETEITLEEFRRIRLNDLAKISKNKNSTNEKLDKMVEILADASVKLSLMEVKCTQPVSLNLNPEITNKRENGSKGASFVLYNVSRLASIRKKYYQGVKDNIYPTLPPVEKIDFSLLTEHQEWALLFNYLLEYPYLIDRCAQDLVNGKGSIHQICKFIFCLCSLLSSYYRRNQILLGPKDHLLPLVQARLSLIMSIEQVLENALALLNIEKVEEM